MTKTLAQLENEGLARKAQQRTRELIAEADRLHATEEIRGEIYRALFNALSRSIAAEEVERYLRLPDNFSPPAFRDYWNNKPIFASVSFYLDIPGHFDIWGSATLWKEVEVEVSQLNGWQSGRGKSFNRLSDALVAAREAYLYQEMVERQELEWEKKYQEEPDF